jgi:hypothetical protein
MRAPEYPPGDSDDLTESESSATYQERFEEEVNKRYEKLTKEEPAIVRALELLDRLPNRLVYHTKKHTEDVIWETILFALADDAPDGVVRQQALAAAWHDTGFLKESQSGIDLLYSEESAAIDMFKDAEIGGTESLSRKDIWETVGNIWDTRIIPRDESLHLEMHNSVHGYMLDADVSNFGRDDFRDRMEEVAEENGVDLTNLEARKRLYEKVITLLKNHSWKTESARRFREKQKQENLKLLETEYLETLKQLG